MDKTLGQRAIDLCISMSSWDVDDADLLKNLQQRVIELNIEVAQYKEAIYNYMNINHYNKKHELVEMFMETHLPDDPDDKELAS